MSEDIIERLYEMARFVIGPFECVTLDAADEIKRLRAEVEQLRGEMAKEKDSL